MKRLAYIVVTFVLMAFLFPSMGFAQEKKSELS